EPERLRGSPRPGSRRRAQASRRQRRPQRHTSGDEPRARGLGDLPGSPPARRGAGQVIVGIDLGTTFSLVAVMRDGRPVVLPNAVGKLLTPSAVSLLDDGAIVVGEAARARASTHPDRTARVWKRDMGSERVWT